MVVLFISGPSVGVHDLPMCDGDAMVRRAGADDLGALVAALVASHVDYIWEVWAVPADGRADRLAELFRTDLVLLGLRHGEVWTTDEVVSVAVWMPGELAVPPEDAAVRAAVAECTLGPRFGVVEAASAAISGAHPGADWHLATMGTRPTHRRKGLGTAILGPFLDQLDRDGQTAGLETSSADNVRFYERLGFEMVADLAGLPGGAPRTWVMRRSPRL